MAVSKLKISFTQQLIIGSSISFNLKQVSTGIETPLTFTWVASRVNPYEVTFTTGFPLGIAPSSSFKDAFEIDEPTFPIELTLATVSGGASFVVITSEDEDITFSGGVAILSEGNPATGITFEITRIEGIILEGLESDNYLINNEIWLNINLLETATKYELSLTNLSNGKFTRPFVLFTNNSNAYINIQPIIKSIFDYPNVRNQNKFQINVKAYNNDELLYNSNIIKNFIRGGNRTELTNQNIALGTILRPSSRLPIWDGFPTEQYFLDNDGSIQITPFNEIPLNLKDFKRTKGCSNIYFKYLNQKGGYSNWLFESYSNPETNNNLGAYVRNNQIEDLGNEVDNSLNVFSKVSAEYYGLIKDLFVSPEIYVWKDLRWVRIFSGRNTSEFDETKRAYSVKAKFDFENRYNTSLLW